MTRAALEAFLLSIAILIAANGAAIWYIIHTSRPALVGLNCTDGVIAFRDQEDDFVRCSMIERINR